MSKVIILILQSFVPSANIRKMPAIRRWLLVCFVSIVAIFIYGTVLIFPKGLVKQAISTSTVMLEKPVHSYRTHEQMKERLRLKSEACSKYKDDSHVLSMLGKFKKTAMLYSQQYNFSYCSVGKTGGTFIKQLLSVIWFGEKVTKTLENSTRLQTHAMTSKFYVNFDTKPWRHSMLIYVARNPYTRLFSAYMDRVFIPSGTGPVRSNSRCRFDVSFQDFLKIVVRNTEKGMLDLHWSPIYYICRPCEVETAFILKQETYDEDLKFVIDSLNLTSDLRRAIIRKLQRPRTTWTIVGIVKDIIEKTNKKFTMPGCIGWYGAIKRVWKAFQIQGYIDENVDIPFHLYNETKDFENGDLFLKSITSVIKQYPLSKEEKRNQRHRVLVNAYRQVDRRTIDSIRRVFKPDFDLFGYYDEPPS